MIVFGGFHDNSRDCKYFNDLYAFDLEERKWNKLETVGTGPSPRSACQMFTLPDGRICVYGGYCKEKLEKEKGVTHQDMFVLSPDKHDTTGIKWRWQLVKQTGMKPSMRTGLATAAGKDSVFMFGGVQDKAKDGEKKKRRKVKGEGEVEFFDELYNVTVEGEKAVWHSVQLTGKKEPGEKKKRRKVKGEDGEEVEMDDEEENVEKIESLALEDDNSGPSTVTVESGAFTISSTVGTEEVVKANGEVAKDKDIFVQSPRFGAGLVMKGSTLYMFGGKWEDGEKDFALKDFHFLDTHKMDTWQTIIENDVEMEWYGSSDEEDEDEEEEDDEDDMDES